MRGRDENTGEFLGPSRSQQRREAQGDSSQQPKLGLPGSLRLDQNQVSYTNPSVDLA